MVVTLVVSQGKLAEEILQSARIISGALPCIESLCVDWGESQETTRELIAAAIERLDQGQGVLVLTDLHGATPTNAALRLAEEGRVEVVCGVNLPMVVRLACRQREEMDLGETADWIAAKGSGAVSHLASRSLTPVEVKVRA